MVRKDRFSRLTTARTVISRQPLRFKRKGLLVIITCRDRHALPRQQIARQTAGTPV